jgi:2-(1,2-epoxy-1,2-dihydrophenyl)acetyl-CoA isomerase
MTTPSIRIDTGARGVAHLVLCRPERRNAIDSVFVREFEAAARQLASRQDDLSAVLLRAEGATFSVGGDVVEMAGHLDDLPAHIAGLIDPFHAGMQALAGLSVPVIGCVQGAAAGGGFSLALACDLLVAAESARFVVAYPALGTTSDGGLSHRLATRLGPHRALDLFLLAGGLDAPAALAAGLVGRVVPDAGLAAAGQAAADALAALPRAAVVGAKALLGTADAGPLAEALRRERDGFLRCAATEDFRERVRRFADASRSRRER